MAVPSSVLNSTVTLTLVGGNKVTVNTIEVVPVFPSRTATLSMEREGFSAAKVLQRERTKSTKSTSNLMPINRREWGVPRFTWLGADEACRAGPNSDRSPAGNPTSGKWPKNDTKTGGGNGSVHWLDKAII